jgi:hypothetical protein
MTPKTKNIRRRGRKEEYWNDGERETDENGKHSKEERGSCGLDDDDCLHLNNLLYFAAQEL